MASAKYYSDTTRRVAEAQKTDYVAFLHRHPFATEAYGLGFTTGVREDYDYQADDLRNVDLPIGMLDNNFRNPDLERYIDRFEQYEPNVAVLGDAPTKADAQRFLTAVADLREWFPDTIFIVVPKSAEALSTLADAPVTLGYPMGYSDVQASDFSDPADWRGLDVHLLGGSPPRQYKMIQTLTQPTVTAAPPANIVGLDWNGPVQIAYKGEFWSRDGWQSADHLEIRETVKRSLEEMRAFWQDRGIWPGSTPREEYGVAIRTPDDHIWAVDGSHIGETEQLEDAIVVDYDDGRTYAYRSELERKRVEYYEGRLN